MGDKSTFFANSVINTYFRGGTYTGGQLYVALYTAAPTVAGGGTEMSYAGYARISCGAVPSTAFSAAAGGATANTALVQFAAIAGGPLTIVAAALFDALAGGNMIDFKVFTGIVYNTGDIPQFPIGGIAATES